MAATQDLARRRRAITSAWAHSNAGPPGAEPPGPGAHGGAGAAVRPEIRASWSRSRLAVGRDTSRLTTAPVVDVDDTRQAGLLRAALAQVAPVLAHAAEEGDVVVAVTDPQVRLLWTHGGRLMRRRAEAVGFVPGGCWDEASIGTNALDLALRQAAPAEVWSAEHYAPVVHGWVCWATPLLDPATGRPLGVLDVSTRWDRAHPLGPTTARVLSALVQTVLAGLDGPRGPTPPAAPEVLDLRVLGEQDGPVRLGGRPLAVTPRQLEVLALLALHPEGISADALHEALYGDARVSRSTLKAEVSHLRALLGGTIASRPYRLARPVRSDAEECLAAVRRGDVVAAVAAYGGPLLPRTESPWLRAHRAYVDVALRQALLTRPVPQAVLGYARRCPHDAEVVAAGLAAAEPADPARALLAAHLATPR